MANEENILKLRFLEQQANELEEKIKLVNQKISEFEILEISLNKIKNSENKEILASVGEGIFTKTKLQEKKFIINVGAKIFLEKNPEEANEIVEKRIKELEEVKGHLLMNIETISKEMEKLVREIES